MADWTDDLPEAARAYLEGRRLDEVECIISDLPGIARGKAVPGVQIRPQEHFHLPDRSFTRPSPATGARRRARRASSNAT